eukprot:Rmarinus@m.15237
MGRGGEAAVAIETEVTKNADSSASQAEENRLHIVEHGESQPVGFVRVDENDTLKHIREKIMDQLSEDHSMFLRGFTFAIIQGSKVLPVARKQEADQHVAPLHNTLRVICESDAKLKQLTKSDLRLLNEKVSEELERRDELGEECEKEDDKVESGDDAVKEEKHYEVVRTKKRVNKEVVELVHIKFLTDDIVTLMRDNTDMDQFYNCNPKVEASDLLEYIPMMKEKGDILDPLAAFLETEYHELMTKQKEMEAENKVTYSALWLLFKNGRKIIATQNEDKVGSVIESCRYNRSCWYPYFEIKGSVVKTDGKDFYQEQTTWTIYPFKGTKCIDELPVQILSEEKEKELEERGEVFRQVGKASHYMSYEGVITRIGYWCSQSFKADGRVMVDGVSFKRCNPNYNGYSADNGKRMNEVPDDKLYMTWPTVCGFSFASKKWGEINVRGLKPIEFDDRAYDRLVLDPAKKRLVEALVQNSSHTFTDLISGKGGGCIFLLHGAPGTGKTLTAEAIAELKNRPLYSVSVGELGTTTDELETRLREILEVAQAWDAVILMDEADIFLERRTEKDIHRNAMVGIFLRLLEYHQGVLFLTTNRVSCFDEAFHSRISVALKYEPLDKEARRQVWENLLEAAGLSDSDLRADQLCEYEINGRQIKTTIRLAQSLARAENVPVSASFVKLTVGVARQFQEDVGGLVA